MTVPASTHDVLCLVTDVSRWPQVFRGVLHAEILAARGDEQVLRAWALSHGSVRCWTTRRLLDRRRGIVSFRQLTTAPPVLSLAGRWHVRALTPSRTEITLVHDYQVVGDDQTSLQRVSEAVDRNGRAELRAVRAAVERAHDDTTVTVHREATAVGSPDDAYDFLEQIDLWPQVHPAVARVRLDHHGPGVQLVKLDLCQGHELVETTALARLCLPEQRTVVYKRLNPTTAAPSHTGRWRVEGEGELVRVSSWHTVTLDPDTVAATGERAVQLDECRRRVRTCMEALDEATLGCALGLAGQPFAG